MDVPSVGELKYQDEMTANEEAAASGELLTLTLRYKAPDGDTSRLLTRPLHRDGFREEGSSAFYFSAAVAGYGMLLRESTYKGTRTPDEVRALAERGPGEESRGTRAGFISLLEDRRGLLETADGASTDPTPEQRYVSRRPGREPPVIEASRRAGCQGRPRRSRDKTPLWLQSGRPR